MTNTPIPTQEDGGATILEIGQQPDAWREVAGRTDEHAAGFLRDVAGRPDLRVILTGAGSSAFAGEIAAPALRRHLNRRVDAVATTDIVASPLAYLERHTPTLLVSFGRSGNSPESLATTELADEIVDDVWHLILTCDRGGELGRAHDGRANSLVVYMPERTNDTGFAMTSSLTSMLLSCLLMLGPAERSGAEALALAAEHVVDLQPDIRALAKSKKQRFVYLGSGPLEGLARESALKLLELTAGEVVSYFDSPLGFRHGPKSVLDGDTLVVVYVSTDPYTRRYDLDIVAEIRAQLGPDSVSVISTQPIPAALGEAIVLPGLAALGGIDDSMVALAYLVFAQYLALFTALEYGKTPDNPYTRRYDLDIVAEIRAQLGPDSVSVISTQPIPAALGDAVVLPGLAALGGIDDSMVALAYLVFAQYLALFTALEYGKTPDNPFPAGEVSRVVRGVTIYPMGR